MEQIIMGNLSEILLALVSGILGFVAWKQRETSKANEARRVHDKMELEAKNAREKTELEAKGDREKAELEARLLETKNEAKSRADAFEAQLTKMNLEAKHQQAQLDFLRDMSTQAFEGMKTTNTQWQNVYSTASERKHDDERHLITILDKLDGTIDRNSQSVDDLAHGLAAQLGNVATAIHIFSDDNKQTEHYIRATVETTNRNIDSALEAHVSVRDRIIPMIDNLEKRLDKLDNCADMLAVLEQIKAILSKPPDKTLPLPESDSLDDNRLSA